MIPLWEGHPHADHHRHRGSGRAALPSFDPAELDPQVKVYDWLKDLQVLQERAEAGGYS